MGSVETSLSDLVTIIVKAPNQQIADQTIKCHLNWSIKKLKDYLSQVYPSKPKMEEQKLIYSGKLLKDTAILKDVLRTYEGQENHTVHLVCNTKMSFQKSSKSQSSYSANSSSVYTDNIPSSGNADTDTSHSAPQNTDPTGGTHFFGQFNPPPNQMPPMMNNFDSRLFWPSTTPFANFGDVDINQQFAMMQQAYAQYISQYMQMMGQPGFGYMTSPISQPVTVTSQPSATLFNNNNNNDNDNFNNRINDNNNNLLPNERNQERNIIRENQAAAAAGNDDEEDGRNNRDWLDWFYVVSRIIVLLSVVYFYSTPLRLLMVVLLICMFYLHQNMRIPQNENVNLNVNNNNAAANNNQNPNNNNENNNNAPDNAANRNGYEPVPQEAPASSNTDSSSESSSEVNEQQASSAAAEETTSRNRQVADTTAQPVQERLSPIALTILAIRTFFLSLVPDQPVL